jgi:glycosyltransferase involved in cell wall biosynthesis
MALRIVQAMGSRHKGGAQRFFLRLVEAFHKRGVEDSVIVKRGGWSEEQLAGGPLKVHSLPFGGALDLATPILFPQALRRAKADILLTYLERATKRAPRGPWVHVARLGGYYDLKDYQRCDHLIANTPGIADYIRESGWPSERVSYVPNFVPDFEAQPVSRASFDTPEGQPLILWLGRMEHKKGPDLPVRALASLPGAYLWLGGSGAYESEVRAIAEESGVADRVRFLGWRDDIHPLLAAADFFVCASRFEALGNIILEAWAHRLPVVAARSVGPEHLIEDRKTGLLVANDDADSMALALRELIENPTFARNIGDDGHRQFHAAYSEDAILTMYLGLFQRLASGRTPEQHPKRKPVFG